MKITIIGAGNSGCAHAFKFTEAGHQVSLIKTSYSLHEKNFEKIQEQGGIWAIDNTNNNKKAVLKNTAFLFIIKLNHNPQLFLSKVLY